MAQKPRRIVVITPHAAAYVFRVSDARLRRLALDGKLRTRTLSGSGWKPTRVYSFDDCAKRWLLDLDRLGLLVKLELTQIGDGAATWQVYMARPAIVDRDGDLATTMESEN